MTSLLYDAVNLIASTLRVLPARYFQVKPPADSGQ